MYVEEYDIGLEYRIECWKQDESVLRICHLKNSNSSRT